ncbi:hypothetical protein LTR70_006008 [Exophiala xenobiotica]|uniref:Small EDRK-rich factor-like N-terminal domain-containing protein n=1 Tax=Lithohypha guttulata TaxID=1690604 RepID=A0ABR0KB19_9EURO|nr:hypothetical protein LTR24_004800 [Lithohypha guttulata]KAK5316977.1 hypothetical protein LTR70_006008 [Exophiala xenobiotica]
MTRGNQREKAREKNLKDAAGSGKKNTLSGTEFQRTKEAQAAIMREKQAKGEYTDLDLPGMKWNGGEADVVCTALEAKAAGGGDPKKK